MISALKRTDFHSSRLTRVLADMALVKPAVSGQLFAQQLGQWLGLHDAIRLRAVHTTGVSMASSELACAAGPEIRDAVDRARVSLMDSIAQRACPGTDLLDLRPSPIKPTAPGQVPATFEPYRRSYLALQRDMELKIQPLRAQARALLAKDSPALRQLAALDAVLDDALAERESRLLAQVPNLLQTRFEQLRAASRQSAVEGQLTDDLAAGAMGWLACFGDELRTVLRAELDLRLQPVIGLIEALDNEVTQTQ